MIFDFANSKLKVDVSATVVSVNIDNVECKLLNDNDSLKKG